MTKCFSKEEINSINSVNKHFVCINTPINLFPKDIWENESRFAAEVRNVLYGSPNIAVPKEDDRELIPNIAHIVWLGGGRMDFLFYLGVLSLINVAKVCMQIHFHAVFFFIVS